jgi:flagellar biosynthesis/type III secretory pathway M-ring protein FliF/YscJ
MNNLQKWFLIVAMWVAILFLIFVFYWILVRPAKIRQMCAEKAKQVSAGTKTDISNMLEINRAIYLDCLKCNGIDK